MTVEQIEKYFKKRNIVTPWAALDKAFDTLVSYEVFQGRTTLVYSIEIPEENYAQNPAGKALGFYQSSYELGSYNVINNKYRYTKTSDKLWTPRDDYSMYRGALYMDNYLEDTENSGIKFLGASITQTTLSYLTIYVYMEEGREKIEGLTKRQTQKV